MPCETKFDLPVREPDLGTELRGEGIARNTITQYQNSPTPRDK